MHQVMTGDPVRRKSLLRRIRSILKTLASDGLLRERGIQFNFGAGNEAGYDLVGEIGKVGVPIDPECFHLKKVGHTPTASDRDEPPH